MILLFSSKENDSITSTQLTYKYYSIANAFTERRVQDKHENAFVEIRSI